MIKDQGLKPGPCTLSLLIKQKSYYPVQTFLKIIPPFLEYPDFSKSFFHVHNVIFETGELFDAWLFEGVNTIISIANFDGGTVIEKPSIFIGEATAHLAVASGNAAQTALNITQHIVLPFDKRPITDTQFMIDVFSMDKTFIHLNFALTLYEKYNIELEKASV